MSATESTGTDAAAIMAPTVTRASERVLRVLVPVIMLLLAIVVWQTYVALSGTPKYILPSPVDVVVDLGVHAATSARVAAPASVRRIA